MKSVENKATPLNMGIVESGIRHASANEPKSIEAKFALVQEYDVFDYIDVTPQAHQIDEFVRCSQKYSLPILAGSCNYIMGLEEEKLKWNLEVASQLGSVGHNTQLFMDHFDDYLLSANDVTKAYLGAS